MNPWNDEIDEVTIRLWNLVHSEPGVAETLLQTLLSLRAKGVHDMLFVDQLEEACRASTQYQRKLKQMTKVTGPCLNP